MSTIAAGSFGEWLKQARAALQGSGGTEVPCGDCTGCCTSGYSIQLRPEDREALQRIPAELLVTAPGFSSGSQTLPALPNGFCPMMQAGQCAIYAHRPQTCLDYDCRIFAAAGIEAGGPDKGVINKRVREWGFSYHAESDLQAHRAVQSAAAFIRENRDRFPGGRVPTAPTGVAVLALKSYTVFLDPGIEAKSEGQIAADIVAAGNAFDAEADRYRT